MQGEAFIKQAPFVYAQDNSAFLWNEYWLTTDHAFAQMMMYI
ncbi:protein of unknown function [Chryseobacterium sp. JV274]|nr:protein of unknown function [Chryseobacterium sp. JV274]CAD0223441.1 protein of unknown function [Chryseobacterium sp. JV274]